MSIQAGYNPRIIEQKLLSYVGEDAYDEVTKPLVEWWGTYESNLAQT